MLEGRLWPFPPYLGWTPITEAVELGERVLVDCQRILGPEHPWTLWAGIVLGLSYQAQCSGPCQEPLAA